ncbi:hypothetical protein [Telmatospirillum sp. J64-1]|uniref:hypothetical protein n=1 Tax=Telmatospirillum sp. J64-1 TaxID=2502183 RepID=UPI00115DAC33|nr:hypothetical protein [Telmatospirillum sp. J64-1]
MTASIRPRSIVLLAGVAAMAALLTGCNEHERSQVLHLEKGVYKGYQSPPLSAETYQALARRGEMQRVPVNLNQQLTPDSLPEAGAGVVVQGREKNQKF